MAVESGLKALTLKLRREAGLPSPFPRDKRLYRRKKWE